jgi:phosphoglucosamine mutase
MKLFGTDGVRGKAGSFLHAELAMRVAMAAGVYFKKEAVTKKILVGKDTRRSGYMIETAIVSGLTAVGYDVIQIGIVLQYLLAATTMPSNASRIIARSTGLPFSSM